MITTENKNMLKKINILYVEDEIAIRDLVSSVLKKFVKNIVVSEDGEDGVKTFQKYYEDDSLENFDLVITDINMPKLDGLDMIAKIKDIDLYISVIITTAYQDEIKFLKKAIDLNVKGYAIKPIDISKLLENIISAVESKILRDELKKQNDNLELLVKDRTQKLEKAILQLEAKSDKLLFEATHDHLTGLYNRQKFSIQLIDELHRVRRYNNNLSIIMYDIDYFKNINDTYGHLIGDQVLIKMSNLVLHYIRDVDILARWGGEEFMILLPETNLKGALIVAQNIRKAIEEASFSQHFKKAITASFGVYEFHKDDTVDNLLQKVDSLLYEAKDSGRNKVCS